jgi:hypothetical protein
LRSPVDLDVFIHVVRGGAFVLNGFAERIAAMSGNELQACQPVRAPIERRIAAIDVG